jgi:hypothetical protein
LRTFQNLSPDFTFRFSLMVSSSFSTGFRLLDPPEEVTSKRYPVANFESPSRVLLSSSPGSRLRIVLTDRSSSESWLRVLGLPAGSPSCVARFGCPIPLLTGSLSHFLWRQSPVPRGVLRSSSPSSFLLRATASPC